MATQPDNLTRTTTEIARKLIAGQCNENYKREFSALFIENPGMMDDVAPELRGGLEAVLIPFRRAPHLLDDDEPEA